MPMTANACSPRRRNFAESAWPFVGNAYNKVSQEQHSCPCNSQRSGLKACCRPLSKLSFAFQVKTGAGALVYAR